MRTDDPLDLSEYYAQRGRVLLDAAADWRGVDCMSKSKFVSILKVVPPNMTTQNGFVWPEKGPVECPDWDPKPECGSVLHGWRWTPSCDINSSNGYHNDPNAKWLVVRVASDQIVGLAGKIKFHSGTVIHCGTFASAIKKIQINPAVAGFLGTATAGDEGTATAGDRGTATAGEGGTATAGDEGAATAGDRGTATAGFRGTATAGDQGAATAGDDGAATAGNRGTATAGFRGTATAGNYGTATAGNGGVISILFFDESLKKYRRLAAEIGVTPGIEPGKKYRAENGRFVEVVE